MERISIVSAQALARPSGGSGGMVPQENFKLTTHEIASESDDDKNLLATISLYYYAATLKDQQTNL